MTDKPLALIIEDDPQQSEIFSYAIRLAGYEVETCADGQAALDLLANINPCLVILDLNLPNIKGDKILAYIRSNERFSATSVILATANPRRAELLRNDSDLILIKPISFEQLRDLAIRIKPQDCAS